AILQGIAAAVECTLPEAAQVQDRLAQRLAGDGAGVYAYAADRLLAFHQSHFLAQLGGADGALLPRWAAPDHDQIVFARVHISPACHPSFTLSAVGLGGQRPLIRCAPNPRQPWRSVGRGSAPGSAFRKMDKEFLDIEALAVDCPGKLVGATV